MWNCNSCIPRHVVVDNVLYEVRGGSAVCPVCATLNQLTDAAISFGLVLLNKETSFSLPSSVEKGQPRSPLCPVHLTPLGCGCDWQAGPFSAAVVGSVLLTVGYVYCIHVIPPGG